MSIFAMNQGSGVNSQFAEIIVPGCGFKNATDQSPIIRIDIVDGKLTMKVWADIAEEQPTHVIELNDALLTNRKEEHGAEPKVSGVVGGDQGSSQSQERGLFGRRK